MKTQNHEVLGRAGVWGHMSFAKQECRPIAQTLFSALSAAFYCFGRKRTPHSTQGLGPFASSHFTLVFFSSLECTLVFFSSSRVMVLATFQNVPSVFSTGFYASLLLFFLFFLFLSFFFCSTFLFSFFFSLLPFFLYQIHECFQLCKLFSN